MAANRWMLAFGESPGELIYLTTSRLNSVMDSDPK